MQVIQVYKVAFEFACSGNTQSQPLGPRSRPDRKGQGEPPRFEERLEYLYTFQEILGAIFGSDLT